MTLYYGNWDTKLLRFEHLAAVLPHMYKEKVKPLGRFYVLNHSRRITSRMRHSLFGPRETWKKDGRRSFRTRTPHVHRGCTIHSGFLKAARTRSCSSQSVKSPSSLRPSFAQPVANGKSPLNPKDTKPTFGSLCLAIL